MTASMVAGCGDNSDSSNNNATTGTESSETPSVSDDVTAPADIDYGSGTITIWVAEAVQGLTQQIAEDFLASDEAYSGYTVDVQAVGEGDAAGNMITDVEGGADIYGFAQDQISRLVTAGALMPVGAYADWISEQNDAGAVGAATVGSTVYAFPMTSDNGYFLYYDSSVVTDPSSLEQIVADCEAAGKNFYFEINSGWYQPSFFFGAGCELTYDTDDQGNFTGCNISYASDAGIVALREMIELASSSSFQNGSSVDNATNLAAIVDGTWDSASAQAVFGDNYACAKLPSFTGSDGATYQLGGFGGYKLLGVKPQEDEGKAALCLLLAQEISNYDSQMARYESQGWGPSNLEAKASDAVQSDIALGALNDQLAYDIPQGNYPGDYWSLATSLGDDVITGKLSASSSDEDLLAALQSFQDTCIGYAE
jgi:arabinogalactan oligomer/maltooligosaccharide transport system substrate-binding protein